MQLRVYILFNQSKRVDFSFVKCPLKLPDVCLKVAFVNGVLFIISIAIFLYILIDNTLHIMENTPSGACPTFKGGVRWALWLPGAYQPFITRNYSDISLFFFFLATLFEFFLFALALYKTIVSSSAKIQLNGRRSLAAILLHENIMYFFV